MKRLFLSLALVAALPASAQIMGELGAYVKGDWNPTATPEFSIVICRWGARDTALSGKDLILGQVASLEHASFAMVLQTPDKGQDTTEVRIEDGVKSAPGSENTTATRLFRAAPTTRTSASSPRCSTRSRDTAR